MATSAPASSPMDELADLEQQAEFFAVLGQDDAAVALLEAHLRHGSGTSPLPFLHLLEIHRRRGHRVAFERARSEHGASFAAVAVEWDDAAGGGRALDDHGQTVRGLQALWATPPEAIRMLERLVLLPGDSGAAFDLAAYRDLLLLYAVARDNAAPADADGGWIDLYLPLDDAAGKPPGRGTGGDAVDPGDSGWPDLAEQDLVVRRSAGRRSAG